MFILGVNILEMKLPYEELEMLALMTNSTLNSIKTALKQLAESTKESVELINNIFTRLSKKKKPYAPVKEIKPSIVPMWVEKINIYYCRNNC